MADIHNVLVVGKVHASQAGYQYKHVVDLQTVVLI